MYTQTLRLAVIAAAFLIAAPASAQHYNHSGDEQLGFSIFSPDNCGRRISQQQAEGIWSGYCTESCAFAGSGNTGCGKKCGLGCGSGGHGGCFNYPEGGFDGGYGGCHDGGCGKSRHGGCKLFSGCKAKAGHGGCSLFGGCKAKAGHGGCSLFGGCKAKAGHGGCKSRHCGCHGSHHGGCKLLSGCKLFGGCSKFGRSAQQCGTNGAYFQEAVGFEYGTSGMQSCVSCNTCGSLNELIHTAAPQSINGGFNSQAPIAPACCN